MNPPSKFLDIFFVFFYGFLFRKLLRDGIKIANTQDLNGITAITLLMLGTTFHCEGSDGSNKVSAQLWVDFLSLKTLSVG